MEPFDVYYYRFKAAGHEPGKGIYKRIYDKLSCLPFLNVDPWDSVGSCGGLAAAIGRGTDDHQCASSLDREGVEAKLEAR